MFFCIAKLGYNEDGYNELCYNELGYNELSNNELGYNELDYQQTLSYNEQFLKSNWSVAVCYNRV